MKLGSGFRLRVLLSHARAKLDVRAQRLPEWLVGGQSGSIGRLHVEGDEPLALLVGDVQVAVHVDDVLKAELAREAVRPAERFRREPCQVLDMMRFALGEQNLQHRICENLGVEQFFEALQRLLSASMFVKTLYV